MEDLALRLVLAAGQPASEQLRAACGDDPGWVCSHVFDWTDSRTTAKVAEWLVSKPLSILIVVIITMLVTRIARWAISRSMGRLISPEPGEPGHGRLRRRTSAMLIRADASSSRERARVETLTAVFRSLATAFFWLLGFATILDVLGLNLGPLIATAGIAGVALAFGTQTMVRDFIAGFFIVAEDQMGVGDTVDLGGGAKGTVERVTLRATHLRDVEGTVWHVPNGQITKVANKSQEWARALIDIVVPYDADVAAVSAVMLGVATEMAADVAWSRLITDVPEVWGIQEFSEAGVEVRLVIKTLPAAQFGVLRELRSRLKDAFDAAGVRFAYAGGPTDVVLVDRRTASGSTPSATAASTGPASAVGGFGGEGHDDPGLGSDTDAD